MEQGSQVTQRADRKREGKGGEKKFVPSHPCCEDVTKKTKTEGKGEKKRERERR